MRRVKLTSLDDINESVFADYICQAVELNKIKGDPTNGN